MTDEDYLDMMAANVLNGFMVRGWQQPSVVPDMVKYCYDIADAMLAEKKSRQPDESQQA